MKHLINVIQPRVIDAGEINLSFRRRRNAHLGTLAIWGIALFSSNARAAIDCSSQQNQVASLNATLRRDQDSMKQLGLNINADMFDDASKIAEEGRKQAMLAASLSLVTGFLNSSEASLGTKSIAGYQLKNGLGSLGTGQTNAIIGTIRAKGGAKLALIPALRTLSGMSDKTATLEYLSVLSRVASNLKATIELGADENSTAEAEALFGIASAIAGKADLAVAVGNSIFEDAKNEYFIYSLAASLGQATQSNEARLNGIKALAKKLQNDVHALKAAQADLNTCVKKSPDSGLAGTWRCAITSTGNDPGQADFKFQKVGQDYQLTIEGGVSAIATEVQPGRFHINYLSSDGLRSQWDFYLVSPISLKISGTTDFHAATFNTDRSTVEAVNGSCTK